jgi:6-phosphogluconolactonase
MEFTPLGSGCHRVTAFPALALMSLMLVSCGGGGGGYMPPPPPAMTYTVAGYVAGLSGSGLSVSYNGGTPLAISRNGGFTAASAVTSGTMYSVTIVAQPSNPAQVCTVTNGSGSVGSASVSSVSVYCPQASGGFAYVATAGSITEQPNTMSVPGSLSAYAIDPNSGALSAVTGSAVPTGPAVGSLQFVPHSSSLWALSIGDDSADDQNVTSSVYVYSVTVGSGLSTANSSNPSFTLDGTENMPPGCGISGRYGSTQSVTFAPSGAFGYASNYASGPAANEGTWVINLSSSAAPESLGALVTGACNRPVTVDPSGQFAYYAIAVPLTGSQAGCCTYQLVSSTVDSTDGTVTAVAGTSPIPIGGGQGPATFDPFGRFVYVLDGDMIYGFTINPSSGALTSIAGSPFSFPDDSLLMLMSPDGRFAYIIATAGLYTYSIDPSTGALAAAGTPVPLQISVGNAYDGGITSAAQIDPSGQFLYVSASAGAGEQGIYAYALDASTGAPTLIPASPFAVTAQNLDPLQIAIVN